VAAVQRHSLTRRHDDDDDDDNHQHGKPLLSFFCTANCVLDQPTQISHQNKIISPVPVAARSEKKALIVWTLRSWVIISLKA
jgi:hypothetical protein